MPDAMTRTRRMRLAAMGRRFCECSRPAVAYRDSAYVCAHCIAMENAIVRRREASAWMAARPVRGVGHFLANGYRLHLPEGVGL